MRATLFAAVVLLSAAALSRPAAAQDDRLQPYRSAVDMYRAGRTDEALRLADTWTRRAILNDAPRLLDAGDRGLAQGVVLLLTELTRADLTTRGTERLGTAETLVNNLRRTAPDMKPFQEHWYAYVASLMLAELDPTAAQTLLNRGLRLVGASDRLHVLSGVALEMLTYPHATCGPAGCRSSDARTNVRDLMLAADAYRRAIALAPHGADAHLRLGRVLFLLGDRAAARRELDEAEHNTNRLEVRYLVLLFRSDIKLADGDARDAAIDAERAVALGPEYQSARIALAHVSDRLGMADYSRKVVDESLRLPSVGDPWWEFRQPAEDTDSMEWMRKQIVK